MERERKVYLSLWVKASTREGLKTLAEAEGRTLSDVARRMIERGLQDGHTDRDCAGTVSSERVSEPS